MQKKRTRTIQRVDLSALELASSETARRINRDILLELIRSDQPISRAELSRRSGLQRSTVSQITEQLLRERWICEVPGVSSGRGRRPKIIRLNETLAALAVDIHPKQATYAIVDLNGKLVAKSTSPLTRDPKSSLRLILEHLQRLRANSSAEIAGIGISVPGRVDPRNDRLIFAPNLRWPDVDLKSRIEAEMEMPVYVGNAATACLLAELTFNHNVGNLDAVLVTTSEGVGAGIFANGSIILGHHGMAGEFGHIPLDPNGPECACGRKGCWEVFASCRAALRYYRELQPHDGAVTFSELLNLLEDGNRFAEEAIERQAYYIGYGMRLIIASLAPSIIYIAGDVTSAWHRYQPLIQEAISDLTIAGEPPRLVPTRDGDLARLRGAAALVFQDRHLHLADPSAKS